MIRIEHNPSRRQLAVFGLAWLLVFSVLGAMAWWKTGTFETAGVFWAIGAAIPAAGLLWPESLRIVFISASYAAFPLGFVISYVILAVIYYMVLTPIGLALKGIGYDPMQRRFDRGAKSYWTPREEEKTSERYFKQF
jgi:hypothetical protein